MELSCCATFPNEWESYLIHGPKGLAIHDYGAWTDKACLYLPLLMRGAGAR